MAQRLFKLRDDVEVPRRWHLDTPIDSHSRKVFDWDFTKGTPVQVTGRLKVPIEIPGKPLDFSEAGTMIPVIHVKVASMLSELAPGEVQLIPAGIEGQPDQYLVMVATRIIHCIDEAASAVSFWKPEHGVPEKVGQYMGVDRLRIDKARVGNAKVFRPEGWEVALIVSEDLKNAMAALGTTGTRFEEV
jgi:hypothetical protein